MRIETVEGTSCSGAMTEERFACRLPPDRSGTDVRLPYGQSRDGRIVHISEVSSGLGCDCTCPGCGTPLVARKGAQKEHHFGHRSSTLCSNALESALHKLAKEVLQDRCEILLPEVRAERQGRRLVTHREKLHRFDDAVLEQHLHDIVPDVIVRKGEHRLLVEMYVTHRCGPEKIERIRELGLSCLEIDLREMPRHATRAEVEQALLSSAPRYWLSNPKLQIAAARLEALMERERLDAEELQHAARLRNGRRLDDLADRFEGLRSAPAARSGTMTAAMRSTRANWLERHVGHSVEGDFCLRCAPGEWQAEILHRFVVGPLRRGDADLFDFHASDVLKHLREGGFFGSGVPNFLSEDDEAGLLERLPWFRSPFKVVTSYLERLENDGILVSRRRRWSVAEYAAADWRSRVEKAKANERLTENTRKSVEAILRSLPDSETVGFDLDRWWSQVHPGVGTSFAKAFACDDPRAADLVDLVRRVESMFMRDGAIVEDGIGLPIAAAVDREIEARRDLAEAKRLEAEAVALKLGEARVALLDADASTRLGIEARIWIDAIDPSMGATPRAAAAGSDAGLARAGAALVRHVAERDRMRTVDRLRQKLLAAASQMRRPDHARVFLTSPHPDWRGRHPLESCVDERSLEELRKRMAKLAN